MSNPVGLYFGDLSTVGWETPDGSDAASYWSCVRGSDTHPVRAVYEVPQERDFLVGDITIDGNPIEFGAQQSGRNRRLSSGTSGGLGTTTPM